MQLIKNYKRTIFYINPKKINYCLYPSKKCQFTHYNLDKLHPHAGVDRGFFKEDEQGYIRIINRKWDISGPKFKDLVEYVALENHFNGKQKWRDSEYAYRIINYIASGNIMHNFNRKDNRWKVSDFNIRLLKYIENKQINTEKNLKKIIIEREKEIDNLFKSILKNGILPCKSNNIADGFINNVSINLGEKSKIFFNHRGHHRLAISKIFNLRNLPIKIAVAKNLQILKKFVSNNDYEKIN
tara:strand:+ start:396 stop:1118 length:723 start_codon:yes stop_codon:yes gene_type:complete